MHLYMICLKIENIFSLSNYTYQIYNTNKIVYNE